MTDQLDSVPVDTTPAEGQPEPAAQESEQSAVRDATPEEDAFINAVLGTEGHWNVVGGSGFQGQG